ncbi:DnaJ C-terminal domain-containing protein [Leisingera methylohalidivorans]|uniref:Molecular chaperone DnaJ n=1 Tax=Leisingera methylohalidivorans DSM 14336 TaxID=999552 RepID=V9VQ68_9RHOB|nr:DnaJ C-terminal domain-containing protein [Leisingera methylohalidivorans]AHD00866.1 molecular chaperone DnaJ [Leisingera methylohalidivorans DSM 14336]
MSDSPYDILGVSKDATQAEIKKAYRKLAKALHPDLSPGDKDKAAEFQKVGAAYDILGDEEKRRRYDGGEIDASGQDRPERQFYRQYAGADPEGRYQSSAAFNDFEDVSDIFADLFGRQGQGQGRAGPGSAQGFAARGADLRYHLDVDFLDAARGAKRTVPLPDGQTIDLTIPAGVRDGQTLRLRGKGQPGIGGGPAGDAYVGISVKPHPLFTRDGNDIGIDLPITFDEAVLGGRIEVPTLSGPVSMNLPKGASSGQRLRLKGKGVRPGKGPAGDQYVRLMIMLPDKIGSGMEDLARRWRETAGQDPRKNMGSV